MSLDKLFSKLFGNKKEDGERKQAQILIDSIISQMNNLVLKSASLNDSWRNEETKINEISEKVNKFEPVDEIAAAKFEQDILGRITAVSSACDAAIAGKMDSDLAKQVAALESAVSQRSSIGAASSSKN